MLDAKRLEEMLGHGQVGSNEWEKMKQRVFHQCAEGLVNAINKLEASATASAKASESLGRKVYWLNWVLAAATVVIAIGTVWLALK